MALGATWLRAATVPGVESDWPRGRKSTMKTVFQRLRKRSGRIMTGSCPWPAAVLMLTLLGQSAALADSKAAEQYRKEVQPILATYCYDCHANGVNKGKVAF